MNNGLYILTPAATPKNIVDRVVKKIKRELITIPQRKSIRKKYIKKYPAVNRSSLYPFSIHCLICRRDVEMAVCSFLSLYHAAFENFHITFHDDGSLTDENEAFISENLNATVLRRPTADHVAEEMLKKYPAILQYRKNQVMALKLIDVKLHGTGTRFAYIDSDILFMRRPDFILDILKRQKEGTNYFNKDIYSAYVDSAENILKNTGVRPYDKINAGLWVMNHNDIDLDQIEKWLNEEYFKQHADKYLLDQTFISMLSNKSIHGVNYLPGEYDVNLLKTPADSVCKHYVGKIRHGYELEGLRYLLLQNN